MTEEKTRPDKGMVRVLVYGTLKKGHGNHRLISNANGMFLGYDSITGRIQLADLVGFPGIFRPDKSDETVRTIRGELWAITDEGLAALDFLEGHPRTFRREKWWTDKLGRRAWVYMLSPQLMREWGKDIAKDDNLLPEGIWRPGEDEKGHWDTQAA